MMRATAPVSSRGSPARGARLDDERVDPVAREPPSGTEAGNAPADDDDRGASAASRAHSLATGSCGPPSIAEYVDGTRQKGTHCEGMPNQLSQPSPIAAASGSAASSASRSGRTGGRYVASGMSASGVPVPN